MNLLFSLFNKPTTNSPTTNPTFERKLLSIDFTRLSLDSKLYYRSYITETRALDINATRTQFVQAFSDHIFLHDIQQDGRMKSIFSHKVVNQKATSIKFINQKQLIHHFNRHYSTSDMKIGQYFVYGTSAGKLVVLDYVNEMGVINLDCKYSITCILVHPIHPYLIVGTENGKVLIWNLINLKIEKEFNMASLFNDSNEIISITINRWDSNIIACSTSQAIRVWNISFKDLSKSPKITCITKKEFKEIGCIDFYRGFDPNFKDWLLISCLDDVYIYLYNTQTNQIVTKVLSDTDYDSYIKQCCIFESNFVFIATGHVLNIYCLSPTDNKLSSFENFQIQEFSCMEMDNNYIISKYERTLKIYMGGYSTVEVYYIEKMVDTPIYQIDNHWYDIDLVTSSENVLIKGSYKYYINLIENGSNDSEIQLKIGDMLMNGYDIEKNETKAIEWILLSANNGNQQAQYQIGLYYLHVGNDLAPDWLHKSARNGNSSAQYKLSCMYTKGLMVEQDSEQAFEWALKSAKSLHKDAIEFVIQCYSLGVGVEKSEIASQIWKEALKNIGVSFKRYRNIFETFGVEDFEQLDGKEVILMSKSNVMIKIEETKYYLNEIHLRKCKFMGKLLKKQPKHKSIKILNLTNLYYKFNEEFKTRLQIDNNSLIKLAMKYYLNFLQFSSIPSLEDHNYYYELFTILFGLSIYFHNEPFKIHILKKSNPIQRCFLLNYLGLMNSQKEDILTYYFYLNRDNIRGPEFPSFIIQFLKSKNSILQLICYVMSENYKKALECSKDDDEFLIVDPIGKSTDMELIKKIYFQVDHFEDIVSISLIRFRKGSEGEVIISSNVKVNLLVEFVGEVSVAYYVEFKQNKTSVTLSPLNQYHRIRGFFFTQTK